MRNNIVQWLGREDSNLRMAESKSAALPLGYAPKAPTDYRQLARSPAAAAHHNGARAPDQLRWAATTGTAGAIATHRLSTTRSLSASLYYNVSY